MVVFPWIGLIIGMPWGWRPFIMRALRVVAPERCTRCGYPLQGLGAEIAQCPECGAARKPQQCTVCQLSLEHLGVQMYYCPRCGADLVKQAPSAMKKWRIQPSCSIIDFSREEQQSLKKQSRLAFPARRWMLVVILALFAVALPASLYVITLYFYGAYMFFILPGCVLMLGNFVMLPLIRRLYTIPLRIAYRQAGYDLCIECGWWFWGVGDKVEHCPECGAVRQPMPATAEIH